MLDDLKDSAAAERPEEASHDLAAALYVPGPVELERLPAIYSPYPSSSSAGTSPAAAPSSASRPCR
jgi:hypothetical protein